MDLADQLHLVSSGHFASMPSHYMSRDRPLDHLLVYVLAGSGSVAVGRHRVRAGAGDLICLLPGRSHAYGSDRADPWDIVWVHFSGQLAGDFMTTIQQAGGVRVPLGLDEEIRDRWVELVIAHHAAQPGSRLRADSGLCGLLGLICYRLQRNLSVPVAADALDVHRLQSYVHEHLAEPVTLADLARQVHLSPTHFARVFKRQFGVSPIYYLIQTRLAHASSLLVETDLAIKQVSAAVGYDDQYYFSRLFKKMIGQNPTAYRRRRRSSVPAASPPPPA